MKYTTSLLLFVSTVHALRGGARRAEDCITCDGVNVEGDDDDYYDNNGEMGVLLNTANLEFSLTDNELLELDGADVEGDDDDYYDENGEVGDSLNNVSNQEFSMTANEEELDGAGVEGELDLDGAGVEGDDDDYYADDAGVEGEFDLDGAGVEGDDDDYYADDADELELKVLENIVGEKVRFIGCHNCCFIEASCLF